MVTVEEHVRNKIEHAKKWRIENPWYSPEYFKDESKIYVTKEMLESKAYRSLSRCAMLIYQDFLAKREMIPTKRNRQSIWKINNNGEIIYPYTEAKDKGFSGDQFVKSIDELQEKGFLDITHQGKGGRKTADGTGDATRYWIDDRWKDYGMDDFRPPRNPRKKDTRKGRGGWLAINQNPKRKKEIIQKRNETIRKKI
jgi:hypothetical protein